MYAIARWCYAVFESLEWHKRCTKCWASTTFYKPCNTVHLSSGRPDGAFTLWPWDQGHRPLKFLVDTLKLWMWKSWVTSFSSYHLEVRVTEIQSRPRFLVDALIASISNSYVALFSSCRIDKLGCPRCPPGRLTTMPYQPFTGWGVKRGYGGWMSFY